MIDRKIYELGHNEYYELIRDANNGISGEEELVIEKRITPLLNKAVNFLILTEKQEAKLISLVLGLIINGMVKGIKLEEMETQ